MTREWNDAVHLGSIDTLAQLLATGADINARDEHGQTALMRAARRAITRWQTRR